MHLNIEVDFSMLLKPSALLFLIFSISLSACSPHPGAGVWASTEDNLYGIQRLVLSFDGRAEFITSKQENATWHCFWAVHGEHQTSLRCTASSNTDKEENFTLRINQQGEAELLHETKLIAVFQRQDENPIITN